MSSTCDGICPLGGVSFNACIEVICPISAQLSRYISRYLSIYLSNIYIYILDDVSCSSRERKMGGIVWSGCL
jgi:hypothetical protein